MKLKINYKHTRAKINYKQTRATSAVYINSQNFLFHHSYIDIYYQDKHKSFLDFDNFVLIWNVTGGLKYVKFSVRMRYFLSYLLDPHKTYRYIFGSISWVDYVLVALIPLLGEKSTYKHYTL